MWQEVEWTAQDGLTLRGRSYGPPNCRHPHAIVCLPGLTRNSGDFHDLAIACADAGYRAITMDSRGRGRSDYAEDWETYSILQETQDVLAGLTALGIEKATLIGTSRGGLISMLIGVLQPAVLAGVLLNDIGPKIELNGLLAIKTYLDNRSTPENWSQAVDMVKAAAALSFPNLTEEEWEKFTQATFWEISPDTLVADYDPNLLKPLAELSETTEIPELWPQFEALAHIPVLVMRGALSTLLSDETVNRMRTVHPDCDSVTIENQGHAPLFTSEATLKPAMEFISSTVLSPVQSNSHT
ncbi:alpha/beta fold hydrolase [Coralliovum pocilloporae]|uniref:alpha/beta fold hydrolase n=1 Tax=Coralliovum pocilloporae TaxID=3066369 RepID=UPI003306B855